MDERSMIMLERCLTHAALTVLTAGCLFAQTPAGVQTFPLTDTKGLNSAQAQTEATKYKGRDCVRVTVEGEDRGGLVLLPGTDFQDGVIEADLALKITTPPGVRYPGFLGIAFRVRPDGSHCELFYVRPGNSDAADQAMRNHTVQYVSEPDFGWYRLRRQWPSVYESHADLAMETWTKVRIEVAGRTARLYLNGSPKASLVVDGLKGEDLHGAVGLWGYTDEESYFSNVRITPAVPQSLKNGSDAAGSWDMRYGSDAGGMDAHLELRRDGNNLSGTWSGPLGENRAVTGTWRQGYVELSFAGEWPKESRQGTPGPVNAFLTGWIDGDSARGRMRVEGRSDGTWIAKRQAATSAALQRLDTRMIVDEPHAVLSILDKRAAGQAIADVDWNHLFASEGYVRLKKREQSMNRPFEDDAFRAFVMSPELLAKREALARTLAAWEKADLTHAASLALAYLPKNATIRASIYPEIKPAHNSFVFEDNAIFMWLDDSVPAERFERTVAHEMNHIGYGTACPPAAAEAEIDKLPDNLKKLRDWTSAFGEGLATAAAAGGSRPDAEFFQTDEVQKAWSEGLTHYATNFAVVQQFYLDIIGRKLQGDAVPKRGFEFFGLVGPWYTVGWKMAVTIEEVYGREAVIAAFCDQRQLFRMYNAAAVEHAKRTGQGLPLWDARIVDAFQGH